jgi:probable rRNA maturation factor
MLKVIVQRAARKVYAPPSTDLSRWAKQALSAKEISSAELTIRIVNEEEMTTLNETYRHKTGTTNVLSFPFDLPDEVDMEIPLLGDIIICAVVVNREALEQNKNADAHWAHMVVHGVLHLLGHDHVIESEADVMEALEIKTLKTLGFVNPYQLKEGKDHE